MTNKTELKEQIEDIIRCYSIGCCGGDGCPFYDTSGLKEDTRDTISSHDNCLVEYIYDLIQQREAEAVEILKTCIKLDVFESACSQHAYWGDDFLVEETEIIGKKAIEYLDRLAERGQNEVQG